MKLQTLQGFRDFLPSEKRERDWIAKKIIEIFELYGFEPLETPTLEYASVILGKYGSEADRLVYQFKDKGDRQIALRYDQTVPTARVLTQYSQQLPKYFRRYQIQNVFRADKPQKGRYREFTQCDIDIFGSSDPISDAEIIACTYASFKNIGYPNIVIKINDRRILFDVIENSGIPKSQALSVIQSLDKLDKKSIEDVQKELINKGITLNQFQKLNNLLRDVNETKQLKDIIGLTVNLGVPIEQIKFIPHLARGLDYYTDMIFEVLVPEYGSNSLGGGGRYDSLINQLGGPSVPAVGIAFGFDRMVEAAQQLRLITAENLTTSVLVTVFNPEFVKESVKTVKKLRDSDISTELYVNPLDKLDKQLKYADKKGIPYVVIIGPDEAKKNVVQLKNMKTKEQEELSVEEVIDKLKQN